MSAPSALPTLRRRVRALLWGGFAFTFTAFMALSLSRLHAERVEQGRKRAALVAEMLAYAFEPLLERGDVLSMQRCAENAATLPGVERVWLVGRDARVVAAGDRALVGEAVPAGSAHLAGVLDGTEPERQWQEGLSGSVSLHHIKPLRGGHYNPRDGADLTAAIWVQVSLPPLHRDMPALLGRLGLVALALAALPSLTLGRALSAHLLRPLSELSRASARAAQGRLPAESPGRLRGEIGLVARNLERAARGQAEARRELDDFLRLVAHDLRAPVANIEGFSERMQRSLGEVLPSIKAAFPPAAGAPSGARAPAGVREWAERVAPECIEFVRSSARQIRRLVDGLQRLSRPLRRNPDLQPVALDALVQQVLAGFRDRLEERSVQVDVGALPTLESDALLLAQVLTHLIENALDAMGAQPLPRLAIAAERQEEEWRVSVSDNGCGISAERRARLFLPFPRLGAGAEAGEGVGLCLVRRILKELGGRIWVESEPGAGSTFHLTLPVEPPPERPPARRGGESAASLPDPEADPGLALAARQSGAEAGGDRQRQIEEDFTPVR